MQQIMKRTAVTILLAACLSFTIPLSGASPGPTTEPATQPSLTLEEQIAALDGQLNSRVIQLTPDDRIKLAQQKFQLKQRLAQERAGANPAAATPVVPPRRKAAPAVDGMTSAARLHPLNLVHCEVGQVGRDNVAQCRVAQVVDENNVLLTWNHDACWYWISGVDTTGLIDNRIITLDSLLPTPQHCWVVSGTKQYRTALGGTKTVPQFTPMTAQEYEAAGKAAAQTPAVKPK